MEALETLVPQQEIQKYSKLMELDASYMLDDVARFRVNVCRDDGSTRIVMRTIPMEIKKIDELNLPPVDEVAAQQHQVEAVASIDVAALVRRAYLRTLSRYPDASEMDRAGQYLDDADNVVHGLRDLMWALLNTKEFIVNH